MAGLDRLNAQIGDVVSIAGEFFWRQRQAHFMTKQFALVNLGHRELARDRSGAPILFNGAQPPREIPPQYKYHHWEEVEDLIDPRHKGPPRYQMAGGQTARVHRIVPPKR